MSARIAAAVIVGLLLLPSAAPAAGDDGWCAPIGADLDALGWRPLTFEGKAPNRFAGTAEGALTIEGDASVSFLFAGVPPSLGARAEALRWAWKAEAAVPPTDLAAKGGDDRTLALYVAFAWDPAQATLSELLRRPVVEMLQGPDAPGRILAYTWGGSRPPGSRFASPYAGGSSQIVILRDAATETGRWHAETVSPRADYRAAFGEEAPAITQIAIVSDGDDTGTAVRAAVRDLCLGNR